MRYSWILFDADDTLFDFKESAKHALFATLAYYGIEQKPEYYTLYKRINEETWLAFEKNLINTGQLRRIRFEKFLEAIGEYREPLEVNAYYLDILSDTSILINGAEQLLQELTDMEIRLGLITNGLKEVQRKRLGKSGIEPFFQVVVVSDEIGVSKPDAGYFDYAFDKMGNPEKEKVLLVGDSLLSDIQGGNNYGIDTCWYNPYGKANLSGQIPKFEIANLGVIHELVKN